MELAEVAHGQVVLGGSPPVRWCLDVQHIPVGTHDMHAHIEEGTHSEQRDIIPPRLAVYSHHVNVFVEVFYARLACGLPELAALSDASIIHRQPCMGREPVT